MLNIFPSRDIKDYDYYLSGLMSLGLGWMKKMVLSKILKNFLVFLLLKILSIGSKGNYWTSYKLFEFWIIFRLRWVAHLEFSHNKEVSELTWDKVEIRLPRTDKLCSMIKSGMKRYYLTTIDWSCLSSICRNSTFTTLSDLGQNIRCIREETTIWTEL